MAEIQAFEPIDDIDWGAEGTWNPTRQQIIDGLISGLCAAGEPWVGSDAVEGSDHGHTSCMWLGEAIRLLRQEDPNG